jgi:hypothetical protein
VNIRFDRTEFAVTAYCTCGWVDLTLGIEAARMRVTRELRNSP